MNKYKVRISNGLYEAPYMIEDAISDDKAIEQAMQRSRLSEYDQWSFTASRV